MYIYIHIPFCSSICPYCDFPRVLYDKKYIRRYLDSLRDEIILRYKNEEVVSIYIGGGTPTSLDLEELEYLFRIISIFRLGKDIEFTIESNVESLILDKIRLLKKYNVNRISLGVQSLNNSNLKELMRNHTKEDVFRVINNLKDEGFDNISIDYIYGINNNIDNIKEDINAFLELDIPHISCYSLIIESNTIFGINKRNYINEDIESDMYKYIRDTLIYNGYNQYEISNYSRNNYESRHNINYWDNGYYYGFGMGAVSYLDNYRITNTKNLTRYINKDYIDSKDFEDRDVDMANTFMLGFRKTKGINIDDFRNKYNISIFDIDVVNELLNDGMLVLDGNRLYIHPDYLYLSNEIICKFI